MKAEEEYNAGGSSIPPGQGGGTEGLNIPLIERSLANSLIIVPRLAKPAIRNIFQIWIQKKSITTIVMIFPPVPGRREHGFL